MSFDSLTEDFITQNSVINLRRLNPLSQTLNFHTSSPFHLLHNLQDQLLLKIGEKYKYISKLNVK